MKESVCEPARIVTLENSALNFARSSGRRYTLVNPDNFEGEISDTLSRKLIEWLN